MQKSESKKPSKPILDDFKDLILSAILDIGLIHLDDERIEEEKKAFIKANRAFQAARKSLSDYYSNIKYKHTEEGAWEILEQIDRLDDKYSKQLSIYEKDKPQIKSAGRNRTFFAVAIEILKVIRLSENNNLDLSWLRDFLAPGGEAEKYVRNYYDPKASLQIPIPSYQYDVKTWIHKLKESMERSYFSPQDGPVLKKITKEYSQKRKETYDNWDNASWRLHEEHGLMGH